MLFIRATNLLNKRKIHKKLTFAQKRQQSSHHTTKNKFIPEHDHNHSQSTALLQNNSAHKSIQLIKHTRGLVLDRGGRRAQTQPPREGYSHLHLAYVLPPNAPVSTRKADAIHHRHRSTRSQISGACFPTPTS